MSHVFISYVKENKAEVDQIVKILRGFDVQVWVDRDQLQPGVRWSNGIRQAITNGAFYIACFSNAYNERMKTYMNEELTIAIEELRQRPVDKSWFIPVLLDNCQIPDRNIGAGETLLSLQWVKLYENWSDGIERILSIVKPDSSKVFALMRALASSSARERIKAADELGNLGVLAKKSVEQLIWTLTDKNVTVRAAASEALGKIGIANEEVIENLLNVVKEDDDYDARHAASALAMLGAPAIPALLKAIEFQGYDKSSDAYNALGQISDPAAVPLLIKLLQKGYETAAISLGNIGKAAKEAVPTLINAGNTEAVEALGKIGDPSALPTLINELKNGSYLSKVRAAKALGNFNDTSAIMALAEVVTSKEEGIIRAAVESLLKLKASSETINQVKQSLISNLYYAAPINADRDEINKAIWVRSASIEMLGKIGDPSSLVTVLSPLLSEDWSIFSASAEALFNIGTPEAIRVLIPELKARLTVDDEGYFNKKTAIRLLGEIASPSFKPLLTPFLSHSDFGVKSTAEEALSKIKARNPL